MEFVLVIFLSWGGNCPHVYETQYKSKAECLKDIDKAIVQIPSGNSENEYAAVKMCMAKEELKALRLKYDSGCYGKK